MVVLWVGFCFLVFLALDVWNRRKTKHKGRNTAFMAFEGVVAIGCFVWWLIGRL